MNTFPKKEHLCGEKIITRLHQQGRAFIAFPYRVVYSVADENETEPVRVMISVPKKRFKHAVDRNRIKRLTREVYRLNKHEITKFALEHNLKFHLSFQYVSNEEDSFEMLEKKMKLALKKLILNFSEPNCKNETTP